MSRSVVVLCSLSLCVFVRSFSLCLSLSFSYGVWGWASLLLPLVSALCAPVKCRHRFVGAPRLQLIEVGASVGAAVFGALLLHRVRIFPRRLAAHYVS